MLHDAVSIIIQPHGGGIFVEIRQWHLRAPSGRHVNWASLRLPVKTYRAYGALCHSIFPEVMSSGLEVEFVTGSGRTQVLVTLKTDDVRSIAR